ncbi:AMP-binding protein [Herminiimonas sp. CN]|uniref:AMP-binding protein n=1 Tax=Herminiimonas sp. CN TaxID=1349818 RepID=UPI001EE66854|nr:AMP-binding protein [Herminiimonas sp. CN]
MSEPAAPDAGIPASERMLAVVRQLADDTHPGHSHQVTLRTSFEKDLALDSLARTELMLRVGKAFGVELPAAALSDADTPRDLLRFLGQAAQEQEPQFAGALDDTQTAGVPDSAQTLLEVLEWHVAQQPQRVHILLHDEQHREHPIRYRDLHDAARAVAAGLTAQGLQPRQTVALMLPTGNDYLASFFGVMMAGGIPVPIYPPARLAQIEDHLKRHAHILSNAEAVLIITVALAKPVARMLQAAVPSLAAIVTPQELTTQLTTQAAPHYRPQPDDIAFLQYTSGSTGDPKGVVLTHANLLANIRALGQAAQVAADDVFVSWLPLYHDMGLIGAWFGSLYHGIPLVLMSPLAFLARPMLWLQMISRHRGTLSSAPNFAYELCVRHIDSAALAQLDLSSWRLAFNGAEPVSAATLASFAACFARCGLRPQAITPVYGLAESSVGLTMPPPGRGPRIDRILRGPFAHDGKALPVAAAATAADTLSIPSCGHALPGHQVRIVDETEYELPERQVGRLEFRGPSATSGYYRNPQGSARLFHAGWLDSGDYAYMAEGEVFITGRVKDLIKRGGRNLYPYDLEQAIGTLPGIRKGCVAVFASGDPATGSERLVIMAETREPDPSAHAGLRRALNQTAIDVIGMPADDIVLAPPHSVLKTSSGKIRRSACKQAYESGTLPSRAAAPWRHSARFMVTALLARATLAARQTGAWAFACYAWSVFALLTLSCGGLIALLQRPPLGRRIARTAARLLLRLTGVTIAASGLERLPQSPHVLLVNHASYLDAVLLAALLPATPGYAFTAKREYAGQRLMRALLTGLGALFIERFDIRRSTEDVDLMAAALRRGENLLVFPEGTFSREAGLKPFHAGAFAAAAAANAPLVAAGLRGTRSAMRDQTWLPHRAPIAFEVGPELTPSGGDWNAITRIRAAARKALVPLSGEFDPSD